MPNQTDELRDLPGAELVLAGLLDLADGRLSNEGLLVAMAATRLRASGQDVPTDRLPVEPERALYERLAQIDPLQAHSRYNALVRRLISFENALEVSVWRRRRETSRNG